MLPSKYSNSIPQPDTYHEGEQKLHTENPLNVVALEQHYASASRQQSLLRKASKQRPFDSSTKQTALPSSITEQYSDEEHDDIKFRYLHGVLNLKSECYAGSSQHNLVGNVVSKQTMNGIPTNGNFEEYGFGPSRVQDYSQSDMTTQQTILPLTKLKRTTNDLPEDIMRIILQDTKSDQQKEDHFQQSTHFDPKRVKLPLEVAVANSHRKSLKEGKHEQDPEPP